MTRHRTGPCTATRHDTALAYQVDRCACPTAREAYRLYRKRLHEGRQPPGWIDSTGVARRLQALAAIGWSTTTLGRRLGYDRRTVASLRNQRRPRILVPNHTRIVALYDDLWDTTGGCTRTQRTAHARGWAPPMAWDDQSIDDPTAQPQLGRPGRGRIDLADITHLEAYGYTRTAIAERLHVDPESITTALRRKAS